MSNSLDKMDGIDSFPLTRESFAAALRRGQGRALMHVHRHGLDDVADLVLQACLEDQSYDRQCERGRSAWMFRFIAESPRRADFRDAILDRLSSTPPSHDLEHLCGLASELAAQGDAQARQSLHARVMEIARTATSSDSCGASAWIALTGESGLFELADCYGARLLVDSDDDVPLPLAGENREAGFMTVLRQRAGDSPSIQAYLDHLERQDAVDRPSASSESGAGGGSKPARSRPRGTLEQILRMAAIDTAGASPGKYSRFGRNASPDDLLAAYNQLLRTSDEGVRTRLLWIFRRTALPRLDDVVLQWAAGPHEGLRTAAITALAGSRDPRVHNLARTMIANGRMIGADDQVLGLFLENYDPSDAPLIARGLASLDPDPEEAHSLASDIQSLAVKSKDPGLAEALRWAYEKTPCTICRQDIVKTMDSLGLLDPGRREECRFDAGESLRAFAEQLLAGADACGRVQVVSPWSAQSGG